MFDGFVSPATVIKRDILAAAVTEAVRYGTTVKEVIDAFFAGHPRPGLRAMLDQAYAASGIPPHEMMEMVGRFYEPEEIEPGDLGVVVGGYASVMPSAAQARELVEASQRLARRARIHERRVKAAQAAHDASVVVSQPDPAEFTLEQQAAFRRPVRARSVQRYSGLRARRPS